jgi:methylated-DNA-[protein]-cysteine S-methyltransferase
MDVRRTYTVIDSPVGPVTLAAIDGRLSGLYLDRQRHAPPPLGEPDADGFAGAVEQLRAYFAGELTEFDLPLALVGTPFQRRVWEFLCTIPFGETMTYGEVAEQLGTPSGARAVGAANGRNPISIVVPCHRLVGSTGSLTGYGGGLDRKRYLLAFERGTLSPPIKEDTPYTLPDLSACLP